MAKLRIFIASAVGFAPLAFGATVVAGPAAVAAAAPSCAPAGATGLTAKVVARPGQTYAGVVDAKGCDVGIYVGPGVSHVVIDGAKVTGANDHGIFVQDTSQVTIENSTVVGNGLAPHTVPPKSTEHCGPQTGTICEDKAVQLVGTTDSVVWHNTVSGNVADGGIGVADDGPLDPAAPKPGTLHVSMNDVVSGNTVSGNAFGCGIVLAAYNPKAGIVHNVVVGNTVIGMVSPTSHLPAVGGIVVAADTPGTKVANNTVASNTVKTALIPGIVVHSNAPGDVVADNAVIANTITKDGLGKTDLPNNLKAMVGILVATVAPGASLTGTTVAANQITAEDDGILVSGATGTNVRALTLDLAAKPLVTAP